MDTGDEAGAHQAYRGIARAGQGATGGGDPQAVLKKLTSRPADATLAVHPGQLKAASPSLHPGNWRHPKLAAWRRVRIPAEVSPSYVLGPTVPQLPVP